MRYTFKHFNERFPDDSTCLQYVFEARYGGMKACLKCGVADPKYYRVSGRKVYECKDCGYQISPLANTIFHKSDTPLRSWFYVMFMFSVSRNGVSAKEVERTLGVTYKCAWRMAKLVRSLMQDHNFTLTGTIEADETYIGGTRKLAHKFDNKSIVFGMVERGGKIKAMHVKSSGARILLPEMLLCIGKNAVIHTDEWGAYRKLSKLGYSHTTVNHSTLEYVRGTAHTNTIEGFWSQLKRSVDGTHHAVSPKYLQAYVDEFAYRYNRRTKLVFPDLLSAAVRHGQ